MQPGTIVQSGQRANLCNGTSPSTTGVYITKTLFDEHFPYVEELSEDINGKIIIFNYHFIKEARRQFSIDVIYSQFSAGEQDFYNRYIEYVNGNAVYSLATKAVFDEFDFWLVEEILGNVHPTLTREYSAVHKWKKIATRDIEE